MTVSPRRIRMVPFENQTATGTVTATDAEDTVSAIGTDVRDYLSAAFGRSTIDLRQILLMDLHSVGNSVLKIR